MEQPPTCKQRQVSRRGVRREGEVELDAGEADQVGCGRRRGVRSSDARPSIGGYAVAPPS